MTTSGTYYFCTGILAVIIAEGIDWVWEYRIEEDVSLLIDEQQERERTHYSLLTPLETIWQI